MNSVTLFGLTLPVDPVAFTLPWGWDVYWYGVLIATGVLLALLYGMKNGERLGIKPDHIFDSFLVVLPVSVLCARAYYIIFDQSSSFKDFFNFNGHGFTGLAIYGGVIGAAVSIIIMQRIYKFSLLAALDVTSIGFLIGQGIGRWGNFVNQEAYGIATGSDWFGMTGNKIALSMGENVLVHPCFLYESVWCIIGFFVLHHFSKKRRFKGQIALMYGAWYGFERTFIEMLRTDSLMLGNTGIRVSSLLSALLCIACVTALFLINRRIKTSESDKTYSNVFETEEYGEIKFAADAKTEDDADDLEQAEENYEINIEDIGEENADN